MGDNLTSDSSSRQAAVPVQLDDDQALFHVGDDGDEVYFVIEGELEAVSPTPDGAEIVVGRIATGELVGELTAATGHTRSATVRARGPVRLERVDRSQFESWLDDHPDDAETIAAQARSRIDRTRVVNVVAELVGPGHPELVAELAESVEWLTLSAGEAIFRQGDLSDATYVLIAGQMRVTASDGDGRNTLDTRIGRGDLIGEMGVIERAPRNASAVAIRDCTLARLPKEAFETITSRHPALMLPLVRKVIERVGDRTASQAHAGAVAIVVTAPNVDGDGLVTTIVEEVSRFGVTAHLSRDRVDALTGRSGVADSAAGTAAEVRLNEVFHEYDVGHRWVIFDCGEPDSRWARRVLRSADRVVLVASTYPTRAERAAIADVRATVERTGEYDLWLAQLNPSTGPMPRGTNELFELSGASRVIQIHRGAARPLRRLARLISGNGTGLALSGGGARSFGQLGALRALHEHGIEVDAIAGTSMGSVIGAFAAICDDPDQVIAQARSVFGTAKLLDYTFPLTSIFAGRRITDQIRDMFEPRDIRDTLIPYTAISTNLTQAHVVEHRSGSLATAVRASVSLPGVFPPVIDGDDLLIDGGVLENLPARPLRDDPAIATVIAIDVAPPNGPRANGDYGHSLGAVDILRHRLRRDRWQSPPLATTVISSMLVGSSQARTAALANGDIDLYISLNLSGVKLLDFSSLPEALDRGYTDAEPAVADWIAQL